MRRCTVSEGLCLRCLTFPGHCRIHFPETPDLLEGVVERPNWDEYWYDENDEARDVPGVLEWRENDETWVNRRGEGVTHDSHAEDG